MWERIKDRLLGKRYREGWPRGVRPVISVLHRIAQEHPHEWEQVRHLPAAQGLAALKSKGLL